MEVNMELNDEELNMAYDEFEDDQLLNEDYDEMEEDRRIDEAYEEFRRQEFYAQFQTGQKLNDFMKPFAEIAEYQAKQQQIQNQLQARLRCVPDLQMTRNEFQRLEKDYEDLGENPEDINAQEQAIYFAYRRTCPCCHRIWPNKQEAETCCDPHVYGCEDCEYELIESLLRLYRQQQHQV